MTTGVRDFTFTPNNDTLLLLTTGRNLLFNVDGMNVKTCTLSNIRNPADSISVQWSLKSITLSLPETCSALSDLFTDDKVANRRDDILWNLVLKPWNVNLELLLIWNRWSLFEEVPWKCMKVFSENMVMEVNPAYLRCVSALWAEYAKLAKDYFRVNGQNGGNSDEVVAQQRRSKGENWKQVWGFLGAECFINEWENYRR